MKPKMTCLDIIILSLYHLATIWKVETIDAQAGNYKFLKDKTCARMPVRVFKDFF
jgi:hypothetical protein